MKILLDQGAPVPLRHFLPGHEINTAFEMGWHTLQNGDLMRAAEANGFILFITTDQNIQYRQNLAERKLSIVVLMTTNWRLIKMHVDSLQQAISDSVPGAYVELPFPPR